MCSSSPQILQMQNLVALSIIALLHLQSRHGCAAELDALQVDTLVQFCQDGLDFNSIREYRGFAEIFKDASEDDLRAKAIPKACIKNRQAILDLDKIVVMREVCEADKIEGLIRYHKKYLQQRKLSSFTGSSVAVTRKFFTKYAIQVAYVCKKNMVQNLEIARNELRLRSEVFDEARDKVYNDEPGIKSNIKLIEEQPDDPVSTNVKPLDETELTLSEYREALVRLKRAEDILTFDRNECRDANRETKIARDKLQLFFKPALVCHQLHRYYAGSILSVAKLANYGYTAGDEELDAILSDNQSIRDWIIAVQVCDPMLYIGTKEILNDSVTIDTCAEKVPVIEPMVYEDNIDELDTDLLNELIPKSEATRAQAQKLMRSAMKKMAKINIMKQLRSGAGRRSIFTKSLSMFSTSRDFSPKTSADSNTMRRSMSKFAIQMPGDMSSVLAPNKDLLPQPLSDRESFEILMKIKGRSGKQDVDGDSEQGNGIDVAVSFDPVSSIITSITVIAIMLCFEWLFFVVMTLAARLCHHLHFNFENLLTFPPKFLSWSDADFSRFNEKIEKIDEDDFLDYDEMTPDEQEQRALLEKVFGTQPPMLYRD